MVIPNPAPTMSYGTTPMSDGPELLRRAREAGLRVEPRPGGRHAPWKPRQSMVVNRSPRCRQPKCVSAPPPAGCGLIALVAGRRRIVGHEQREPFISMAM
jgi:hypothetical protein